MNNDFSAATGMTVTVNPLTWTDLSGDGARAFVADTPIGRFVFGTDNLGQAYHQDPDGEENHPTEAAARQRAEAVHGMMLTERVGALGVTVAAVNAYGGTAAAEPREGESLREMLIRTIGSHSMESADGDEAIADDVLAGLQRFLDAPRPASPDVGEAVAVWPSAAHLDAAMDAWGEVPGNQRERMSAALYAAFRHRPPAASSTVRVAELEAALRTAADRLNGVAQASIRNGMDKSGEMAQRWADEAAAALSPAAPEPKS